LCWVFRIHCCIGVSCFTVCSYWLLKCANLKGVQLWNELSL
jgi:hypothetical protein